MKAKVAEHGRVTIPKMLRESLGVKAGTVLEFSEEHGRLIAIKAAVDDPVSEVYGCLGKEIETDVILTRLRAGTDRHR
jgi:antitoxin PrlF